MSVLSKIESKGAFNNEARVEKDHKRHDFFALAAAVVELFPTPFSHIKPFSIGFGKPRYWNPKETNYVTDVKDELGFIAPILRTLSL